MTCGQQVIIWLHQARKIVSERPRSFCFQALTPDNSLFFCLPMCHQLAIFTQILASETHSVRDGRVFLSESGPREGQKLARGNTAGYGQMGVPCPSHCTKQKSSLGPSFTLTQPLRTFPECASAPPPVTFFSPTHFLVQLILQDSAQYYLLQEASLECFSLIPVLQAERCCLLFPQHYTNMASCAKHVPFTPGPRSP